MCVNGQQTTVYNDHITGLHPNHGRYVEKTDEPQGAMRYRNLPRLRHDAKSWFIAFIK